MSEEIDNVAAYIRVSTQSQKEEESHVRQREHIERWSEGVNCEHITWYEDIAISGQSDEREDYQRLMDEYDEYDAVVVRELSRFGRDPIRVLQDVEGIVESDTDFISITEDFDTTSAMGKAFMRMMAVINGLYADLRREQAVKAAEKRREKGLPLGRPPKLNDGEKERVYDLRRKGISYTAIAAIMRDEADVENISRETIRRYCKQADVEPEDQQNDD